MRRTLILALGLVLAGSARAQHQHGMSEAGRSPIHLDATQRQAIGLTYGTVERRPVEKTIRTVARLDYDERRLATVTLKVSGYVEQLFVDYTGKPVRKGEPLLSLYSPDLVSTQQEYLLARETRERLRDSRVPGAQDAADSLVRASRERLRLWDLSEQQIRALEQTGHPGFSTTLQAPISGVVTEKMVVKGQRVEPGMPLYRIADLSALWVYADIYEQDLPFVRPGLEARLTLPYYPDRTFTARLTYVAPMLDPKTRTARARFELANDADPPLRPEMYGDVELRVPLGERLVVPDTAVLDSGRQQVVFLDGGDGRLIPRDVRVGGRFDHQVEVLEGLEAGQRVVTSANFLVDSESRLTASESMMGMMGALGMGDTKMESARPMEMGGGAIAPTPEDKRVGDLVVAVFPGREPASVGESALRVRVRDVRGAPVTGATVRVSYTMDMPGMAVEEAAARELGDGVYEGMAKFTMAGPWGVVVEIVRPGQAPVREKFVVRVAP